MKHFINHHLMAPNVMTVPVDPEVVAGFTDLALSDDPGPDFFSLAPWKKISDIRWISGATLSAFDRFQDAYRKLGIADHVREYLDLDEEVRYFTGFLHTRSDCKESNFHVDWIRTNNEGFTLLTPVCGLGEGQKLLFKKLTGETCEYEYRMGEAIIFGDHFIHATPVGRVDPPFTLLAFNFGTDKLEHWDKLLRTQGRQCPLVQRPDGKFVKIDPWKGIDADEPAFDRSDILEQA